MKSESIDKRIGSFIITIAISFFIVYAYLLLISEWKEVVLRLSILVIVGIVISAIVWLGLAIRRSRRIIDR
ncbi:MAG: hypothetical protein QW416_04555 [Candidatus Nitrosocaldaceae archaeon]